MSSLRVVFMGTPDFAVPCLSEIIGADHDVVAVYTQPPRPAGRGMEERRSPVHELAEAHGIPVFTPVSFRDEGSVAAFAEHDADVAVVVAYGLILPQVVLDFPRSGCLNLHASLLPRWRGAAPIQRAIMAGDSETGVAVMQMESGLDTGPVCLVERIPINPEMNAGELHDRLATVGASLMVRALSALSRDGLVATPQDDADVTYAAKISKEEARIDWSRSAAELHDHIRGLSPWPGAWFEVDGNRAVRIKVLSAAPDMSPSGAQPGTVLDDSLTIACGSGSLKLLKVQRQGKGVMDSAALLRGFPIPAGTVLG